mmetsp:Transcript_10646/g.35360  ORF Transcript_10646/g.35360 Transcript_10646/m.35360 type:complete len:244 (+) Transcript_10646:746-1477(+)
MWHQAADVGGRNRVRQIIRRGVERKTAWRSAERLEVVAEWAAGHKPPPVEKVQLLHDAPGRQREGVATGLRCQKRLVEAGGAALLLSKEEDHAFAARQVVQSEESRVRRVLQFRVAQPGPLHPELLVLARLECPPAPLLVHRHAHAPVEGGAPAERRGAKRVVAARLACARLPKQAAAVVANTGIDVLARRPEGRESERVCSRPDDRRPANRRRAPVVQRRPRFQCGQGRWGPHRLGGALGCK